MVLGRRGMVCTSQQLTSLAGAALLRDGGNALDTCVCAAAGMLTETALASLIAPPPTREKPSTPTRIAASVDGMALAAETGNQAGAPALFALLAEAQRAAGQLAEAQGTVATGLAVASQTGQPLFDADLHRLDGELLLATGGTADEAAARHHRALAIAREQGARSFELRAATSLARLWRDQGKRAEARELLAPVYGWFTEGFDTRDLVEGKALLEEL